MVELFITFDTEDFISKNSIWILRKILESLEKNDLKGLFFITGHMAEKLQDSTIVIDLLNRNQIGYHSSGHSVHPTIFEFTDIADYEKAYKISLERETSHINPLTGEIEGKGGFYALKNLLPRKRIIAFRAPGHCWSPPHLEALGTLGIRYDFSARISFKPVNFKEFTFYPYPIVGDWNGGVSSYNFLLNSLLRYKTVVMTVHPSLIVNQDEWDSQYHKSNPEKIVEPRRRNPEEASLLMNRLDVLFKQIGALQKMNLLEVTPDLRMSDKELKPLRDDVKKWYQTSVRWAKRFNYVPKFLYGHFTKFYDINS